MHARTGEDFARLLRNALSGTYSTSKMRDSFCLHSQAKNGQSNLTFSSEGILALSSEYCCMSSCSLCALCSCSHFKHRRVYRSVTLASRVLGLGFLGKACLSPLIEKYSGGGGKPPGTLSIEITACSQAKVPDHQQHNCITSFWPAYSGAHNIFTHASPVSSKPNLPNSPRHVSFYLLHVCFLTKLHGVMPEIWK